MDLDALSPANSGMSTPVSEYDSAPRTAYTTPALSPRLHPTSLASLPLSLNKPDTLQAVDPFELEYDEDLVDVPVSYLKDVTQQIGQEIFNQSGAELELPEKGGAIPQFMNCPRHEDCVAAPTHILAFVSESGHSVQYCFTLGLLYAFLSRKLSHLSANKAGRYLLSLGSNLLPVEQVRVPEPSTLPLLHHFAHHNSPADLLLLLLPSSEAITSISSETSSEYVDEVVGEVCKCENDIILNLLDQIVRFRRLLIFLEIGDDSLWDTLGMAWTILSLSLQRRGRRASMPLIAPAIGTVTEQAV